MKSVPEKKSECPQYNDAGHKQYTPYQKIGKYRLFRIARHPLHCVRFRRLERERKRERYGGYHVDPEDLNRRERQHPAGQDGGNDYPGLTTIGGKNKGNGLFDIVIYRPSFNYSVGNRLEIIIHQDHFRRLFCHFRSLDAH